MKKLVSSKKGMKTIVKIILWGIILVIGIMYIGDFHNKILDYFSCEGHDGVYAVGCPSEFSTEYWFVFDTPDGTNLKCCKSNGRDEKKWESFKKVSAPVIVSDTGITAKIAYFEDWKIPQNGFIKGSDSKENPQQCRIYARKYDSSSQTYTSIVGSGSNLPIIEYTTQSDFNLEFANGCETSGSTKLNEEIKGTYCEVEIHQSDKDKSDYTKISSDYSFDNCALKAYKIYDFRGEVGKKYKFTFIVYDKKGGTPVESTAVVVNMPDKPTTNTGTDGSSTGTGENGETTNQDGTTPTPLSFTSTKYYRDNEVVCLIEIQGIPAQVHEETRLFYFGKYHQISQAIPTCPHDKINYESFGVNTYVDLKDFNKDKHDSCVYVDITSNKVTEGYIEAVGTFKIPSYCDSFVLKDPFENEFNPCTITLSSCNVWKPRLSISSTCALENSYYEKYFQSTLDCVGCKEFPISTCDDYKTYDSCASNQCLGSQKCFWYDDGGLPCKNVGQYTCSDIKDSTNCNKNLPQVSKGCYWDESGVFTFDGCQICPADPVCGYFDKDECQHDAPKACGIKCTWSGSSCVPA
ncbi:MAG: hypothetical protein AB7V77_03150 [Candidatus Woesearchaeota archaeon]